MLLIPICSLAVVTPDVLKKPGINVIPSRLPQQYNAGDSTQQPGTAKRSVKQFCPPCAEDDLNLMSDGSYVRFVGDAGAAMCHLYATGHYARGATRLSPHVVGKKNAVPEPERVTGADRHATTPRSFTAVAGTRCDLLPPLCPSDRLRADLEKLFFSTSQKHAKIHLFHFKKN